ncbi:MAG: hypothetical protein AAFV19_02920 [Pseudomonadota bacterium]
MVTLQEAVQALEKIRLESGQETTTETDRALATGIEAFLWMLLEQKKKLEEIEAVMSGVSRTVDRLKEELLVEHNADIEAVAASVRALEQLVVSMKRVG